MHLSRSLARHCLSLPRLQYSTCTEAALPHLIMAVFLARLLRQPKLPADAFFHA